MRKTFLFFVAILIIPSALAYPITVQLNGNMNFNTAVYHCSDAACTSTTSYTSTAGNPNTYTINNLGSGMQYFAEYDYVSDRCYVSHSYKNWFDESIGNGPWQYTINFQKQTACKSDINSVLFASSIYDNQTQQITARIKAPLNSNPGGPGIIPASLQYYYSTNVSVLIEVRNQTSLILSQIKSGDIIWNNSRDFAFTLPLLQAGNYSITTKTNINDCMCSSYVEQTQTGTFTVLPQPNPPQPPQNQTNQMPVVNFTYLPQNPVVNQIITFDASSSYDVDGSIISYSWNFGDGTNATGIIAQHAFSTAGSYSVSLIVKDSNNSQSAIIRIIPVSAQQPAQQQNQTSAAINHVSSIDKIELKGIEPLNAIGSCSKEIKFMFGFYNNGEKLKDVYINFKIPELSISIDSERFDIARKETKYIEFGFVPDKNGVYQSIISIYYKNDARRILQDVKIDCKGVTLTAAMIFSDKSYQATVTAKPLQTSGGITGNVINGFVKPNANLLIFLLFVIVIAEIIALYFFSKKQ